jgi:hypothetical protein
MEIFQLFRNFVYEFLIFLPNWSLPDTLLIPLSFMLFSF